MTPDPTTADELTIDVDGCAIHARAWGDPTRTPITLIHGSAAHIGWWTPIATELAADHRVVALELSGHGDSGWRDGYDAQTWADEVAAVIEAFEISPTVVVAHSLGALVTIMLAAGRPDLTCGLMLLDPLIRLPREAPAMSAIPRRTPGAGRVFATLDEAKMSFHLRPNEPVLARDRLLEVAADSFKEEDGGWVYKADPDVHQRLDDPGLTDKLAAIPCPIEIVYGAQSPVYAMSDPQIAVEAHDGLTEVTTIAGAYHHLMFDHGPELVTRIRAFTATLQA